MTADRAMGKNYTPPADQPCTAPPVPQDAPSLALRIATRLADDSGAYFNHDAQVMSWAKMVEQELESNQ
jgi:hypothetical protein